MFLVSPSFVAVPWQDSRKWQLCVRRGRDEVNGVSDITAADREHIIRCKPRQSQLAEAAR